MNQTIQLKRAYDPSCPDDGYRVYIDRLWPRGLSHETFHYDRWDKEISPQPDCANGFIKIPTGDGRSLPQNTGLSYWPIPHLKR